MKIETESDVERDLRKPLVSRSCFKGGSQKDLAAVNFGRGERIRTSDLSVPNHRFGKKLSFCHFESCSHHEFIKVLRFVPIRYQWLSALCCEFCPQIGHHFLTNCHWRRLFHNAASNRLITTCYVSNARTTLTTNYKTAQSNYPMRTQSVFWPICMIFSLNTEL